MAKYTINGKAILLDPTNQIGVGGEATIYKIGGKAVKIYKTAQHIDYQGSPNEQKAADARLLTHQTKLQAFPKNLPSQIVKPEALVYDSGGKIAGYAMRLIDGGEVLLRYGEKSYRTGTIPNSDVNRIFMDLYDAVDKTHKAGVVIGDFNDLNIIVNNTKVSLVDADSFQFGKYLCQVFTTRFVDPTLCGIPPAVGNQSTSMSLMKPHNAYSDWYAYSVMLFQSLLFVDPYGGIYKPANQANKIPHGLRPIHRITVFHDEVKYPKPAIPYKVLPDDLIHYFVKLFTKDVRGDFPAKLLGDLRWTKCSKCGAEHARNSCPECTFAAPAAIVQSIQVRGNVTSTQIFKTRGSILYASVQHGKLCYLWHDNGAFYREGNVKVVEDSLRPTQRFRIGDNTTYIGEGHSMTTYGQGFLSQDQKYAPATGARLSSVDKIRNVPLFAANSKRNFWIESGTLYRDGQWGRDKIGDVLQNQTLFWVGETFGFGFYQAGSIYGSFVFDADKGMLNDRVDLPHLKGQIIDSTVTFSDTQAWFFTTSVEGSKQINRCFIIDKSGKVIGSAQAENGDPSWLGRIKGHAALHNFLLAATDEGVISVAGTGDPVKSKEYPDTEPFVDASSNLFAAIENKQVVIYVVGPQDIKVLKIK